MESVLRKVSADLLCREQDLRGCVVFRSVSLERGKRVVGVLKDASCHISDAGCIGMRDVLKRD